MKMKDKTHKGSRGKAAVIITIGLSTLFSGCFLVVRRAMTVYNEYMELSSLKSEANVMLKLHYF